MPEYRDEAEATLREGESLGLEGPALLDYYYLARLANRSGLTTRNERWSACSMPAFIRACFDLTPKERLSSEMHRRVVEQYKDDVRGVRGGTRNIEQDNDRQGFAPPDHGPRR